MSSSFRPSSDIPHPPPTYSPSSTLTPSPGSSSSSNTTSASQSLSTPPSSLLISSSRATNSQYLIKIAKRGEEGDSEDEVVYLGNGEEKGRIIHTLGMSGSRLASEGVSLTTSPVKQSQAASQAIQFPWRSSRAFKPTEKVRAQQEEDDARALRLQSKRQWKHQSSTQQDVEPATFKKNVARVKSNQLGRTASLPQQRAEKFVQVEEGSESLPLMLGSRKRGRQDDEDVGEEEEEQEEQEEQEEEEVWETEIGEGEDEEDGRVGEAMNDGEVTWEEDTQSQGICSSPNGLPRQLSRLHIVSSRVSSGPGTQEGSGGPLLSFPFDGGLINGGEDEVWDEEWADEPQDIDNVSVDGYAKGRGLQYVAERLPGTGASELLEEEGVSAERRGYGGGDEDEGDLLAKLLARAERMRNGEAVEENESGGIVMKDQDGVEADILLEEQDMDMEWDEMFEEEEFEEEGNRRDKALAYLESIPLRILSQIQTSLAVLNEEERTRLGPKKKSTGAGAGSAVKGIQEGPEVGDADDELLLEDLDDEVGDGQSGQTGKKGKRGNPGMERVGIQLGLINRKTGVDQLVCFPDDPFASNLKTPSQQKITEIMRVAVLMYEAILINTVTTKRDIFYKDVELFRTQATVDKLVDDIAASAGLKRQDFMCATSKGLIASSSLKVFLQTGEELSFSSNNPSLIPPIERIGEISAEEEGLDWVLIVEKDAVFQTLCSSGLLDHPLLGCGAIITGKGYPDLATLQLVSLMANTFASTRFYALVDADPHGLDILSVYTNGSRSTKFSYDHADLALGDRLEWMGVKASEWNELGVRYNDLLQLSERDVQKATAMLSNRSDMPPEWRRELVQMLHLNRKSEIQVLATRDRPRGSMIQAEGCMEYENGIVQYVMDKLK